jgi:protein NUD1
MTSLASKISDSCARFVNIVPAFVDSPSKASSARSSLHDVQLNGQANGSLRSRDGSTSRRSLSRSNASLFMAESARKGDATFLTEWSFEVAHDRLVTVITDVQPFKPYWEELDAIALDDKHLDSVARLKEFLPKLDALSL